MRLFLLWTLLSGCSWSDALKCYDCTDCPYPWRSSGIPTYGSFFSVFSRVQSCYKKEFYNPIDRRLDRVTRGALDRACHPGKLEAMQERSKTYCCTSSLCNGSRPTTSCNLITLLLGIFFVCEWT